MRFDQFDLNFIDSLHQYILNFEFSTFDVVSQNWTGSLCMQHTSIYTKSYRFTFNLGIIWQMFRRRDASAHDNLICNIEYDLNLLHGDLNSSRNYNCSLPISRVNI